MLGVAAAAVQAGSREEELAALRARIEALRQTLEAKESVRREARDALRDSERAISDANRALAALAAEARQVRAEATGIAKRRSRVERQAAERRADVERMLRARHAGGAPDALRVALSGEEPATLGRRLHYLRYVSLAAAELMQRYRDTLEELAGLERALAQREERLRAIEHQSRADRDRIVKERAARQRVLQRIAGEVRRGRREIDVLRADEARLARLVASIARIVESVPERGRARGAFSTLRGDLRLPVRGELTGRFGAPRGAAGIDSKGVFIRAREGEPVRAIAPGQVVYADWMRGFGNLLIVDHGEGYLSVYANNEALLRQVGDVVGAGQPIATVGSSGGNDETGLYFELRHLGRAFDPLSWVKLK